MTARTTFTHRDLRAGCFVCHGTDAHWTGPNAQALAARHHDSTGHPTWCDVHLSIQYGRDVADDRQCDIEDAIAATASGSGTGSGGRPVSSPLPSLDEPAVAAAGSSAPTSRPIETRGVHSSRRSRPQPEYASRV